MQIRCPHCQSPIEIVDDDVAQDVSCPSCGSSFSLAGCAATVTYYPASGRTVGHFELVDVLGVGAFGTVWKARDTKLDRIVALKIPRKDQLSAAEIELFLREARATAQLRHPHIVTVHEVGRDGDTVYIVSDLVEGVTLSDWLSAQKPTFGEAAGICAAVAEALHHAHEQGVIHRDLKPGNIMLDGDGRPHLMDFGLAKREAGEITMTVDGHVLGTPAYMSPEQARGEAHTVDRRTDVYSLGAVLFQMLTGELPFRGTPRMLLHQVINEEPRSPRSLNDRIPRDLETICLKALAKEPGRRYATALAMADDLGCCLRGEPILARPVSHLERGWRWCRRRPLVAGLTAAMLTAMTVGTGVSTYFAIRSNRFAREAEAQAEEATAERGRADAGFREARRAVDEYFTAVSENKLLNVPGLQSLRKELLESALRYYETYIDQHRDDPATQAELAATYARVAEITGAIGEKDKTIDLYQRSIEIQLRLVRDNPAEAAYNESLARSYNKLGGWQSTIGRHDEADVSLHRATQIAEDLNVADPTNAGVQRLLARCLLDLGAEAHSRGELSDAESRYQQARSILENLVRENPANYVNQSILSNAYAFLGAIQANTGRHFDAIASLQAAVSILESLVRESPRSAEYQEQLARRCHRLAQLIYAEGRLTDAEALCRKGVVTAEKLMGENPAVSEFQHICADANLQLGSFQDATGREADAEISYKRSIELGEKLVRDNPTVNDYQEHLARTYSSLGNLQRVTLRVAEAENSTKRSVEILEQLVRLSPTVVLYRESLAGKYLNLGNVAREAGRLGDAEALYKQAAQIGEQLVRENPNLQACRRDLSVMYMNIGVVQEKSGRPAEAKANHIKACDVAEDLVNENPTISDYRSQLGAVYLNLSSVHRNLGEMAEAVTTIKRAIATLEKLVEENPKITEFRRRLAGACGSLSTTQCSQGQWRDAAETALRTIAISEVLFGLSPTADKNQEQLSWSYVMRGETLAMIDEWHESAAAFTTAVAAGDRRLSIISRLALAQLSDGNDSAYREACAKLVARYDEEPAIADAYMVVLACILGERAVGDLGHVVELAEVEAKANPNDAIRQTLLGGSQLRAGQTVKAIATLQRAILRNRGPGKTTHRGCELLDNLFLAQCYEQLGHAYPLSRQIKTVRRIVAALEKSAPTGSDIAVPWFLPLAIRLAKRELERMESANPGPAAWAIVTSPNPSAEQLANARRLVGELQTQSPDNAAHRCLAACVQIKDGKPADAIKVLEAGHADEPARWALLVIAHLALGEEQLARDDVERLRSLDIAHSALAPADLKHIRLVLDAALALTLKRAKEAYVRRDWAEAADLFSLALPLGSAQFQPSMQWSDSLAMLGKWREAADVYARSIDAGNDELLTLWMESLLQLIAGDETGYRATCARMLKRYGNTDQASSGFLIALACSVGESAVGDMGPVVALAQKAVDSDPRMPPFWTALGTAQFRNKQIKESIETLKKSMPLHELALILMPGQASNIQLSRLSGETTLALAYRAEGKVDELATQRALLKKLIETTERSPPEPSPGMSPWAVRFAIEIAKRELGRTEPEASAVVPQKLP